MNGDLKDELAGRRMLGWKGGKWGMRSQEGPGRQAGRGNGLCTGGMVAYSGKQEYFKMA